MDTANLISMVKAKKKSDGEWVIGSHFCLHHPDGREHIHHFLIPDGTDIPKERTVGDIQVEVDKDTICRFPAFLDAEGNYIWEHDILKCNDNENDLMEVCFSDFPVKDMESLDTVDVVTGWHLKPVAKDSEPLNVILPMNAFYLERMKAVICGNIFDKGE